MIESFCFSLVKVVACINSWICSTSFTTELLSQSKLPRSHIAARRIHKLVVSRPGNVIGFCHVLRDQQASNTKLQTWPPDLCGVGLTPLGFGFGYSRYQSCHDWSRSPWLVLPWLVLPWSGLELEWMEWASSPPVITTVLIAPKGAESPGSGRFFFSFLGGEDPT